MALAVAGVAHEEAEPSGLAALQQPDDHVVVLGGEHDGGDRVVVVAALAEHEDRAVLAPAGLERESDAGVAQEPPRKTNWLHMNFPLYSPSAPSGAW